jgi:nicotinate-nucleotide adenylyltransferase
VAPERPASIGILGGTFNPPHLGHLALARYALGELDLQRVVLMPAHASPHKVAALDPGPEHRLRMCSLIVREEPGVAACALEINRGGLSYTVDTLTAIHASNPDAELTFIVGADTASTLPAWREPARLLALANLAVAARETTSRTDVLHSLESIASGARGAAAPVGDAGAGAGGGSRPIRFLDLPPIDVSSSAARRRVAEGRPVEGLVGRDVAGYIAEHGLYRGGAS